MKKIYHFLTLLLCVFTQATHAQVGVNATGAAPDPSAMLDVSSTTKGLLIPRVALTASNSNAPIGASIVTSMLVYNTATAGTAPNNVVPSFYYWNGSAWVVLGGGSNSGTGWGILGNTGTIDGTNFIGTTDNIPLNFRVNNLKAGRIDPTLGSTFYGSGAGNNNTLGSYNTATGINTLLDNTLGSSNTATGANALQSNTVGGYNTATGGGALSTNVAGSLATAIGAEALRNGNNTATPFDNTNVAVGYQSIKGTNFPSANTGLDNTAIGFQTLQTNSIGSGNTANGTRALYNNTFGSWNTGIGLNALYSNTHGIGNIANGYGALGSNTIAHYNTAIGVQALSSSVAGSNATAIGYNAMRYANSTASPYDNTNVAVGFESLRGSINAASNTGFSNTALGYQTLRVNVNGDYNTAIGLTALALNTSGDRNTALGTQTLNYNTGGNSNTAVGTNALLWKTGGDNNTALGDEAGVGAAGIAFTNCTFIGANSSATVARTNVTMLGAGITNAQNTGDNQVLLGNTSVSQIRAQVTSITAYSDARFKSNISENIPGLSFITKLKPVTYNQNPEILHRIWGTPAKEVSKMDFLGIKKERFIGFLAQDVEKAANACGFKFPGIEAPKNDKEVYSLRYVDFIMPMVKAIQEQQAMIEKQQKTIEILQAKVNEVDNLKAEMAQIKSMLLRASTQEVGQTKAEK